MLKKWNYDGIVFLCFRCLELFECVAMAVTRHHSKHYLSKKYISRNKWKHSRLCIYENSINPSHAACLICFSFELGTVHLILKGFHIEPSTVLSLVRQTDLTLYWWCWSLVSRFKINIIRRLREKKSINKQTNKNRTLLFTYFKTDCGRQSARYRIRKACLIFCKW
jgi:hypothetical protein